MLAGTAAIALLRVLYTPANSILSRPPSRNRINIFPSLRVCTYTYVCLPQSGSGVCASLARVLRPSFFQDPFSSGKTSLKVSDLTEDDMYIQRVYAHIIFRKGISKNFTLIYHIIYICQVILLTNIYILFTIKKQ